VTRAWKSGSLGESRGQVRVIEQGGDGVRGVGRGGGGLRGSGCSTAATDGATTCG
jgi:hypothetical protein